MNLDQARRLDLLSRQLKEHLMGAALCANEIDDITHHVIKLPVGANPDGHAAGRTPYEAVRKQLPLLDESTLSVIWNGKSLHLGHTVTFRLLARLARSPNRYVTHMDLLQDVWDDADRATATIRSVVRHLRCQLRNGGMEELAIAIRGYNGRYILAL